MKELSLFKSLDTCSTVTNMLLTVITTPPAYSVNLSNITILLSLQFNVIKSNMQSCGVCYFTFVVLHLHTACSSSLQELEQCPLSIHHLHDMAYIQRTGGGY